MLQKMHEGVHGGHFSSKSSFVRFWMPNIGGPLCTRILSNIAKLVTTINELGI